MTSDSDEYSQPVVAAEGSLLAHSLHPDAPQQFLRVGSSRLSATHSQWQQQAVQTPPSWEDISYG